MAKLGEGDSRWIVEQRADGTNVNNWHWTEKNCTEWSKTKFKEVLVDLQVDSEDGYGRTTEVTSADGEATANNRKAKLIFFYEFNIKLKWKGETKDKTPVTGTIEMPNVSEENDLDEIEVIVKINEEETPARRKVKDLVRTKGAKVLRAQIGLWLKLMREEYAINLILPTDHLAAGAAAVAAPAAAAAACPAVRPAPTSGAGAAVKAGARVTSTGQFEVTDTFKCRAEDVFLALLEEGRVRAYTQSEAKIDAKVGGAFSLFNGNVTGTIKDLVPYSRIVMAWRFKDWTEGHFSEVTIALSENDGEASLRLTHTGVPTADIERTREGWRIHQFERMKLIFGFGSGLSLSL